MIRRRKAAPESDTTVHKIGLISKNFTGFHSNKKGQFSAAGSEGLPVFRLFTALIFFGKICVKATWEQDLLKGTCSKASDKDIFRVFQYGVNEIFD